MKRKFFVTVCLVGAILVSVSSCLDTETDTSAYVRLQEEVALIEAELADNPPAETSVIVRDASGFRMVIKNPKLDTISLPPSSDNILVLDYVGKLFSNGEVFDSREDWTIKLATSSFISAWTQAIPMMTEGMEITLYVPSSLGYGARGSGAIPPNAILVFDMHLKTIDRFYETQQLTDDKKAIADTLAARGITNTTLHDSGIRYVTTVAGTGITPKLYDQVTFKYTGKLLNGTVFAQDLQQVPTATANSFTVDYIPGLVAGLQLMKKGGKATFYIPSTRAYGATASTGVPANSNLVYEVELLDVVPNE